MGDKNKAKFWDSPWLEGIRPRDVVPKIFGLSRKKGCTVSMALQDNSWVHQIDSHLGISLEHIQEFANLWEKLSHTHLPQGIQDTIT